LNLVKTVVGTTGGDSDLSCDVSDRLGAATSQYPYLDCTAQPGTLTVDTTDTDALQVQTDLHQAALNDQAAAENSRTIIENRLTDAQSQALIIGQNAYVRALENGSSEAASRSAAQNAIDDYYSAVEANIISTYNRQHADWLYRFNTAQSEDGVSTGSLTDKNLNDLGITTGNSGAHVSVVATRMGPWYNDFSYWSSSDEFRVTDQTSTETYTLANGSTVSATGTVVEFYDASAGQVFGSTVVTPVGGEAGIDVDGNGDVAYFGAYVTAEASDGSEGYTETANVSEYARLLDLADQQRLDARSQISTVVNGTYDQYQAGDLNTSDLVDPYVLASERSPGDDFQGWANAQLTSFGVNSPENYEQIGAFDITTESGQYTGVLHASENPPSGMFAAGNTYDPANIGGSVYLVTSSEIVELQSAFTISNITARDGSQIENVTIEQREYSTTNVSELQSLYESLQEERQQIEAREQEIRAPGTSAPFEEAPVDPVYAAAAAGGVVLLVILTKN
jgi:hypothetical protein